MLQAQGAVVTGGSRGIGAAIVRRLAAEGAGVVFGYRSDERAADAVLRQVHDAGGRAWAVAADLAEPDRCRLAAEGWYRGGGCSVKAGGGPWGSWEDPGLLVYAGGGVPLREACVEEVMVAMLDWAWC